MQTISNDMYFVDRRRSNWFNFFQDILILQYMVSLRVNVSITNVAAMDSSVIQLHFLNVCCTIVYTNTTSVVSIKASGKNKYIDFS